MKCPVQAGGNAEILLDYCARMLDRETTALLEAHMTDCPDCRAFRDAQSELWSNLDAWNDAPVPPDFNRRIFARIDAEEQKAWWRQWNGFAAFLQTQPAMPFAAAVLALAAFLFEANSSAPAVPQAPVAADVRLDSVDVEQAEHELEDMDMLRLMPGLFAPEDGPRSNSL